MFEFLDVRPVVRQPAAIERIANTLEQPCSISQIRTTHMELPTEVGRML